MSHIITVLSKGAEVHFKNKEVLLEALRQVRTGQVTTTITDYAGIQTKVEFGIRTSQYSRGVGFEFDKVKGEYVMKTDTWDMTGTAQKLIGEISANYQKAGHLKILAKYGYLTTTSQDEKGTMIIGRSY